MLSHVEIDLPDNPLQYTAVPNADLKEGIWGEAGVNEANVAMSATETLTTNERVLGADPFVELTPAKGKEGEEGFEPEVAGGIGEEDFLTLVLPYVTTAREGVKRLGALLDERRCFLRRRRDLVAGNRWRPSLDRQACAGRSVRDHAEPAGH